MSEQIFFVNIVSSDDALTIDKPNPADAPPPVGIDGDADDVVFIV